MVNEEIGFGSLQQAQCFLICHKDAVRVQLQDAAGAGGGHRAGHGVLDGLCFGLAVGYHQHLACLHDGLDAHGIGLLGHEGFVAVKEALVGFDGGGCKVDAVGLQLKGFARLIEADMTIGADAQQLQVDAAQLVDDSHNTERNINMIHLINDYYMTADGNSYTVAKAVQRDAGKFSMNRARYYTTLAQAVSSTAECALRDRIAAGQVSTLTAAVDELRRIKAEIIAAVGSHSES